MVSFLPQASFIQPDDGSTTLPAPVATIPFAGRIGANQEFSVDKTNQKQVEFLKKFPDAAPWIPWKESLSPHQFLEVEIWKAGVIEGVGSCLLTYITCFIAIGLGQLVNNLASGPLVPSLLGGMSALIVLPLLIFAAGPLSGGHLNPLITIATFFTRLATLPRSVIYVAFQTFGGAIAGLLLRASFDTRDFQVPGCQYNSAMIPIGSAFAIEFTTDFLLIFLSFSVGLDPRQRSVFGPALSPIFVGLGLAICTFGTSFSRPGYTGFSGNPARCFGAMVGSHFSSYHWIHWVGPLVAAIAHGVLYACVPPYCRKKATSNAE